MKHEQSHGGNPRSTKPTHDPEALDPLDAEHTEERLRQAGVSIAMSRDWQELVVSPEGRIPDELRRALDSNYDTIFRNELIRSSLRFLTNTMNQRCGGQNYPAARAAHNVMVENEKNLIAPGENVSLDEFKDSLRTWIKAAIKAMTDELSHSTDEPSPSQPPEESGAKDENDESTDTTKDAAEPSATSAPPAPSVSPEEPNPPSNQDTEPDDRAGEPGQAQMSMSV